MLHHTLCLKERLQNMRKKDSLCAVNRQGYADLYETFVMASYKPTPRSRHVAVAIDERTLLVWGGRAKSDDESRKLASFVEILDISTGQWEKRATSGSSPPGGEDGSYATLQDKLYYFSGKSCDDSRTIHNSLYELDLSTLNWSEIEPKNPSSAPLGQTGSGMVALEDMLVVMVGLQYAPQHSKGVYLFHLQKGEWFFQSTTGDSPPPCAFFAFDKVDSTQTLLHGGYRAGGYEFVEQTDTFILDMNKWKWSKLQNMESRPQKTIWNGRAMCCLTSPFMGQEHTLLLAGGTDEKCTKEETWVLDFTKKEWKQLTFQTREAAGSTPLWFYSATVFESGPGFRQVIIHGGQRLHQMEPTADTSKIIVVLPGVRPLYQLCLENVVENHEDFLPILHNLPGFAQSQIRR